MFVEHAKASLDNTPELLPVLKEAGVVDSGGAGIVYFFEGIKKYLEGDTLDEIEDGGANTSNVDYSKFNTKSKFEYGYCIEFVIQLLDGCDEFLCDEFKETLAGLGESIVVFAENDKVKVHIHGNYPEKILAYCHKFGEFLSMKIENMTVQHNETVQNIMYSSVKNSGKFSVVAVAFDRATQKLFIDMGADAVIYSDGSASAKDFIDAFSGLETEEILVFPNSSDSIPSAGQAKKLYEKANVTVLGSRGIAECYATLPIIDYEEQDIQNVVDAVNETISGLYVVSVVHREKEGNEEFYAFSGKEIVTVQSSFVTAVVQTIDKTLERFSKDIITIFQGKNVTDGQIEEIIDAIRKLGIDAEVFTVYSDVSSCDAVLSFE